MSPLLRYLQGYPADVLDQVTQLSLRGTLVSTVTASMQRRYPQTHSVTTDRALYDYVQALKQEHLRRAEPVAKVQYDQRLRIVEHALGTHRMVSRVQGTKLKAKREIRIASLFKEAPQAFLRMIAVHELAHLKEREHDRAFYALCTSMEPDYHQIEFDLRLWLTVRDVPQAAPSAPVENGAAHSPREPGDSA